MSPHGSLWDRWADRFRSPESRRRRLLPRVGPGPLRAYLERPLPDRDAFLDQVEMLSLDLETTGLDPARDSILSVGYTVIRGGRVVLAESGHHVVRVAAPLPPESVVVHGISDDRARNGEDLDSVLSSLLPRMAGRVMVAHFTRIERGFLRAACRRLYEVDPPLVFVDTLRIERRRLERIQTEVGTHHLRLFNARARYGLPRYRAHNAMEDAIATAELFLAQMAYRGGPPGGIRLRDLS